MRGSIRLTRRVCVCARAPRSAQVGFTLRETQLRMLTFTLLLQAASRNRVPTRRLIAAHVAESLVFVPVMLGAPLRVIPAPPASLPPLPAPVSRSQKRTRPSLRTLRRRRTGVLFFLFELFSDQLLAFLLLALVWVCELLVRWEALLRRRQSHPRPT